MKRIIFALALLALALPVIAAPKACEELQSEIDAKLQAKGVTGYTLEIVASDAATTGTVVGTCEKGSKKIVYKKG